MTSFCFAVSEELIVTKNWLHGYRLVLFAAGLTLLVTVSMAVSAISFTRYRSANPAQSMRDRKDHRKDGHLYPEDHVTNDVSKLVAGEDGASLAGEAYPDILSDSPVFSYNEGNFPFDSDTGIKKLNSKKTKRATEDKHKTCLKAEEELKCDCSKTKVLGAEGGFEPESGVINSEDRTKKSQRHSVAYMDIPGLGNPCGRKAHNRIRANSEGNPDDMDPSRERLQFHRHSDPNSGALYGSNQREKNCIVYSDRKYYSLNTSHMAPYKMAEHNKKSYSARENANLSFF